MEIPEEIAQAVKRGATVLDQLVPNWHKAIKLEELNMENCHTCMLGQLFGHDAEAAVGSAMYDLPIAGLSVEDYNRGKRYSNDEFVPDGYDRGLELIKKHLGKHIPGKEIGCSLPHEKMLPKNWEALKCAWANEIAERLEKDHAN